MIRLLVVCLLAVGGIVCLVGAWISNRRWTRDLDNLGIAWQCKRWSGEDNNHYHMRLKARIGLP